MRYRSQSQNDGFKSLGVDSLTKDPTWVARANDAFQCTVLVAGRVSNQGLWGNRGCCIVAARETAILAAPSMPGMKMTVKGSDNHPLSLHTTTLGLDSASFYYPGRVFA